MKKVGDWYFPDGERHMIEWIAYPSNRLILNGRDTYQGKKQQAVLTLCKSFRSAVDVGAHIGFWTYNLAHAFQFVHAFEPMHEHRLCFEQNIHLTNVKLYARALGEEQGMVSLSTNPTSSGDTWVSGTGSIPMERLDDYGFEDIDLIKVDCEGYELHVLRGAEATLSRCKPVVCVEQKPGMPKKFGLPERGAVAFLESLGAKLRTVISGDYLLSWD